MKSWYEEVKEIEIQNIASRVGMTPGPKNKRYGPCPNCKIERTSKDKRPPVKFFKSLKGANLWVCNGCDMWGNAFDLVSFTLFGKKAGDLPDFKMLREFFTGENICEIKKIKMIIPKKEYPPADEVKRLLKKIKKWSAPGKLDL